MTRSLQKEKIKPRKRGSHHDLPDAYLPRSDKRSGTESADRDYTRLAQIKIGITEDTEATEATEDRLEPQRAQKLQPQRTQKLWRKKPRMTRIKRIIATADKRKKMIIEI